MNRVLILLVIGAVAGCSRIEPPSSPPPSPSATPSPTESPNRSPTPSQTSVATPGPTAAPTPTQTPSVVPVDLPDELAGQAWAIRTVDTDPVSGEAITWHVHVGSLGRAATTTLDYPGAGGANPTTVVDGGLVAILVRGNHGATVDIVDGATGAATDHLTIGRPVFEGTQPALVLDSAHRIMYGTEVAADGRLDIRRYAFDGTATTLITLDARFAAGPFPPDRFGIQARPDGGLVADACTAVRGCRLWQVPVDAPVAPDPMALSKDTPVLCYARAVDDRWLIVSDFDVCGVDTDGVPLPMRAISLVDGTSHLVSHESSVVPGRVVSIKGRPVAIATRQVDGQAYDVIGFDVATARATRLVAGISDLPGADSAGLVVSSRQLPGTWILVVPFAVDPATDPLHRAFLFDVVTRQVIELPAGTFGYD